MGKHLNKKFNVAPCHSHENGNLFALVMIIPDSRSTDCGNDSREPKSLSSYQKTLEKLN